MKKKKLVIRLPVLRGHGVSSEEEAKIKAPHYESAPGATIIFSDDDITLVSGQLQTLKAPPSGIPDQNLSKTRVTHFEGYVAN